MSQGKMRSRDHDGFPWIMMFSVGSWRRRCLGLQIGTLKCILGEKLWP